MSINNEEWTYSFDHRFRFDILMASSELRIEKEAYVYPAISFIGEFGGSLGLFLGVSFLTIFDILDIILKIFEYFQKQINF